MRILFLRKKILTVAFCVSAVGFFYTPNSMSATPSSVAPTPPAIPNNNWPYSVPANTTQAMPTIDRYGATYLPQLYHLGWLGQLSSMLVNYADFSYQLESKIFDGSTAPFNAVDTGTGNPMLIQTQNSNMQQAANKTKTHLAQQLTFNTNNSVNLGELTFIPGTDIGTPCAANNNCPQNPPPPTNNAFNAETLFGQLGYTADQAGQNKDLDHLLFFLSLLPPFKNPNLSTDPGTLTSQLGLPDVQKYLVNIRAIAAAQSLVSSNFNYLAQERKILAGLGTQSNMSTKYVDQKTDASSVPIPDASQLQLDKYLIDRRLNNPNWYAKMNTAAPATLQRETLFLLAEMQRQAFETRMLNERILATLSLIQVQMMNMNSQNLAYQLMKAENAINPNAKSSLAG